MERELTVFSEEMIETICRKFGMKCQFSDGVIFVSTTIASWRLFHDGRVVTAIYHQNYRNNMNGAHSKNRRTKFSHEFHRQDKYIEDYYDALDYIYCHDKFFFKRKHDTRMDKLFRQIHA